MIRAVLKAAREPGVAEIRRMHDLQALRETLLRDSDLVVEAMLASSMAVNSVLLVGNPKLREAPLVRVHSSCMTGDVFGSQRCECGPQFISALTRRHEAPSGGLLITPARNPMRRIARAGRPKILDLNAHGLHEVVVERHVPGVSDFNNRYLAAKRDWEHQLEDFNLSAK